MSLPTFTLSNVTREGLAIGFAGTTLYLFATGQVVPVELLGISTLIIGNYFGLRSAQPPVVSAPREDPLPKPATGQDE